MRIVIASFKGSTLAAALLWSAMVCAAPSGTEGSATISGAVTASVVQPSIEILAQQSNLAGTCGGSAFNINTFINVDNQASADVKLTAPGVGTIEEFTDETGSNIGPFTGAFPNFHILPFAGGLSPNTVVTLVVTTYTGHALSGTVSYTSSLVFNCTTGTVLSVSGSPVGAASAIPALSDVALAATAFLVALLGMLTLRRRASRRKRF